MKLKAWHNNLVKQNSHIYQIKPKKPWKGHIVSFFRQKGSTFVFGLKISRPDSFSSIFFWQLNVKFSQKSKKRIVTFIKHTNYIVILGIYIIENVLYFQSSEVKTSCFPQSKLQKKWLNFLFLISLGYSNLNNLKNTVVVDIKQAF